MSFKTAFTFEGHLYQLEFTPRSELRNIAYTVVIGSELSLARTTVELIPDTLPGSTEIHWKQKSVSETGKMLSEPFIQAVGRALERHDE